MKLLTSVYLVATCVLPTYAMNLSELEQEFLKAAASGAYDMVADCISKGVNVNATGKYNETAFYKAVRLEQWSVAHLLLDQPTLNPEINPVSTEPQNATTTMHILVKKCKTPEHFRLIQRILELRPNLDILDGAQDTPLIYEIYSFPNPKVVKALVKAGAGMIPSRDGRTPLSHSIHWYPELVSTILHSRHLALADLQKNMQSCRRTSLYDNAHDNKVYGYRLSFEVMKTYYNVMLTLGHIDPLQNEWRKEARTSLNVPFLTTLSQAKSIAAHVAEARFKGLHNAWCNS